MEEAGRYRQYYQVACPLSRRGMPCSDCRGEPGSWHDGYAGPGSETKKPGRNRCPARDALSCLV